MAGWLSEWLAGYVAGSVAVWPWPYGCVIGWLSGLLAI